MNSTVMFQLEKKNIPYESTTSYVKKKKKLLLLMLHHELLPIYWKTT
jgi:hypothetical protein